MKVYSHKKCSTCKKAIEFLLKKNIVFDLIDIQVTSPSVLELKKMLKHVQDLKKLLNTSGMLYRSLMLKEKIHKMSESEVLSLLAKEGMLVKRPFLLTEDFGLVGFREGEWDLALKNL